ncbi:T9SS type A sorting domain-containing protein [Pedobacter sp.]|uniref:T9SS type A sorting domain-containing protein n=1 Tax=Pedobacter sp. TaxID=1411316 RepID=UPI0031D42649
MKKTLLFIAFSSLFLQLKAQTTYDFGTTNQATIAPLYASGSTAPQWPLDTGSPYIPLSSMGTVGITSRNNTAGNVQLVNSPIAGLTGGYLKFVTGSTTDINSKFGVYDQVGATKVATVKFKIHVPSTSATGSYVFAFGNGAAAASANLGPNVGQNLVVLRFAIGAGVVINHYSSVTSGYVGNDFIGGANSISKDVTHTVTVFMNNEATGQSYETTGTNNLSPGTYDVWVDGAKVLAGAVTAGLASNNVIEDMNFINSVGHATSSVVYFDDYVYSNALTPSVLPVTLSAALGAKAVGTHVALNWTTASEQNSNRFEIWHATNGKDFNQIGQRPTTAPNGAKYSFTHSNAPKGNNYYKLIQVDNNGNRTEYGPAVAFVSLSQTDLIVKGNCTSVSITLNSDKALKEGLINVTDITGRVVGKLTVNIATGANQYNLPLNLAGGVYVATVKGDGLQLAQKFILY